MFYFSSAYGTELPGGNFVLVLGEGKMKLQGTELELFVQSKGCVWALDKEC